VADALATTKCPTKPLPLLPSGPDGVHSKLPQGVPAQPPARYSTVVIRFNQ